MCDWKMRFYTKNVVNEICKFDNHSTILRSNDVLVRLGLFCD